MPTISGRIVFDINRNANIGGSVVGLANLPVVLQDTVSLKRLIVLTNVTGDYSFINVPAGSYKIVEAYGLSGGTPTPGDFGTAVVGAVPTAQTPPIGRVPAPPPGAANVDCVTPNTLTVTVAAADVPNQNIFNGPVTYTALVTEDNETDQMMGSEVLPCRQDTELLVPPPLFGADLLIENTANKRATILGDTVIFRITVSNLGPAASENVVVSDNTPTGLVNLQYSTNNGAVWQLWGGSHSLDTLPNGAVTEFLLRGSVSCTTSPVITNTVSVTSTTPDPDSLNNTAHASVWLSGTCVPQCSPCCHPSCDCEQRPSCGCKNHPSCDCCRCPSCDCEQRPSCDRCCRPSCDCEQRPSCGCGNRPSCDRCGRPSCKCRCAPEGARTGIRF